MLRVQRRFNVAVWKYEISRCVFKNTNKWNFISTSGHVMFYLLYKMPVKYQTCSLSLFTVKGAIYHVAIAMEISSPVKTTCYFQMVFVRKLIWFFVGGCIIITTLIAVWILYPNYHKILQTFTLNIFQEFIIHRASDTARGRGAVEKICEIHKNTQNTTKFARNLI